MTSRCSYAKIDRRRRGNDVKTRLIQLIEQAPWREAITYRETWPHEYVMSSSHHQRELLAAICDRFRAGEGVPGRFFKMENTYLFIGSYK